MALASWIDKLILIFRRSQNLKLVDDPLDDIIAIDLKKPLSRRELRGQEMIGGDAERLRSGQTALRRIALSASSALHRLDI
jgi:hypothetical protein